MNSFRGWLDVYYFLSWYNKAWKFFTLNSSEFQRLFSCKTKFSVVDYNGDRQALVYMVTGASTAGSVQLHILSAHGKSTYMKKEKVLEMVKQYYLFHLINTKLLLLKIKF